MRKKRREDSCFPFQWKVSEMRKRVATWLVIGLTALIILSIGFAIAGSADHVDDINKAFNCLDDRVEATSLSLEEAVFAALAKTPDPKVNLTIFQQKSSSGECWPNSGCSVKATAQVALAKIRMGENVSEITEWLKSKGGVTQQMTWYLQVSIDSNEPASCVINYDDSDKPLTIGEDMKLSGTLGSCLSVTPSGYWMKIANNCLDKEFSIQCDKDFRTNLLYEKETGGTIYVSSDTHGAGAGAWTTEKIIAKCLKESGSCNYEGSLWAATALYASGEDISEYAPYLRALAADNEKYFPSAFLVAIYEGGDEHYAKIIDSERVRPEGAYWQMPSSPYGKFYDTALAMMALGGADSPEIDNARTLSYLFTNQDESGCWGGGNIRDTAFIIYAAQWPRSSGTTGVCGNGVCDAGETSVSCPADCPLPQYICGDGVVNGEEACDGTNLSLQNCTSKGFAGGTLGCTANCTFDTSSCTGVEIEPVCGDGVINGSEVCDCGADGVCTVIELDGNNCTSVGSYAGGSLGCAAGCLTFNVSQCYTSGGPPPGGGNETGNQTNGTGGGGGPYNPNLITDCELAGLFCVPSRAACLDEGGSFFPQETHACNSFLEFCCTVDVVEANCADLQGTVCPWDAPCTTSPVKSKDGPCCVGGTCEEGSTGCTSNDDCPAGQVCNSAGVCITQTSAECNDDEDCDEGEECQEGICVPASGGSNLWIWIVLLLVLIVLVVLGIIYRDKLRVWWYQMRGKAKASKVGQGGPPPGMVVARRPPPRFGPPAGMRPVMGGGPMIRPGIKPAPAKPEAKSAKEKEDEETLRKLKEMSK